MSQMPPEHRKTNGMAISGFVLSFFPCLGILAIVFSAIGLSQTGKDPSQGGRGLAIAGLAISISLSVIYWFVWGAAIFASNSSM